ncbi:MAG: hypothetical protein ACXWCB_13145 [Acidimicrobiales bacterium]
MQRLDGILARSSADRGSLGAALNGVRNCTTDPATAATQIQTIATSRGSEAAQVAALNDAAISEAAALKSTLLTALSSSKQSDDTYHAIIASMDACGAIDDPRMQTAAGTDAAADAAKEAFVSEYNPVAARYGLKADWVSGQI